LGELRVESFVHKICVFFTVFAKAYFADLPNKLMVFGGKEAGYLLSRDGWQ